jgi:HKD family nuclease
MEPGLYEKLMTAKLRERLAGLGEQHDFDSAPVDSGDSPLVLTRHFSSVLHRVLEGMDSKKRPEIINALLEQLQQVASEEADPVLDELEQLLSIQKVVPLRRGPLVRPSIPLNSTDLLINARGEHRVGTEIIKELASADRVDLLCSFLKWSGFRILREALEEFKSRGGILRVITTCYLGATDVKALDALAEFGSLKVSYDSRRTRLHAKAWLFHRDTGYSTGFIGSSNMSSAALLDGLEWNVRLARCDNPSVLQKFEATFESYWEDPEFEPYVPGRDHDRFVRAVREERIQDYRATPAYHLEVRPYPFQLEILQRLQAERAIHGRWNNLVVAATGTGKTVIAALDYRSLHQELERSRLLFVAHCEEILEQSLVTFRAVLKDGAFGDKWTGRNEPEQLEHLFASVQKLSNVDLTNFSPEHFDVLVVDEFHHSAAPTYERLINYFKPKLLLGLTATPERADGVSILHWFDGRISAELRLWDALEKGLLSPFQYFGIHDNTDLRAVSRPGPLKKLIQV